MGDGAPSGFIPLILIFAAMIAVIPGTIGAKKGYKFFLYWLFGFLLFVVATPEAILRRPKRICPACAEGIKVAAKVCPHCLRDVAPEAGYESTTSEWW